MANKNDINSCSKIQSDKTLINLPERPIEPLPSECCGTGCTPCVYDTYDDQVKIWEEECCRIIGQTYGKKESVLGTDYKPFEIESIKEETHDSCIFRFKLPTFVSIGLKVGQHLILRWKAKEKTVTRQYTPVSDLTARGHFDILIKIYKDGEMSQYVKTWKVGDIIEWRGPYGRFSYRPQKWRRIVMLAAGTGLAPMSQVISHILSDEDEETWLRLMYACRTYQDILLKTQLDVWADYWNFSATYFLSEDSPTSTNKRRYGDDIQYGRISQDLLTTELANNIENTLVLICGTKSFDQDMVTIMQHLGVPESNYFTF